MVTSNFKPSLFQQKHTIETIPLLRKWNAKNHQTTKSQGTKTSLRQNCHPPRHCTKKTSISREASKAILVDFLINSYLTQPTIWWSINLPKKPAWPDLHQTSACRHLPQGAVAKTCWEQGQMDRFFVGRGGGNFAQIWRFISKFWRAHRRKKIICKKYNWMIWIDVNSGYVKQNFWRAITFYVTWYLQQVTSIFVNFVKGKNVIPSNISLNLWQREPSMNPIKRYRISGAQ